MEIRRINSNIGSGHVEKSKEFYAEFLGLKLVMDMEWILTFASESNPTAQISIIPTNKDQPSGPPVTLTIEVSDVDEIYSKAKTFNYKIVYPITTEPWGVRRFGLEDPNGIIINIMMHLK